MFETVQHTN